MNKARYTSGLVILILLASLIQWPMGQAIVPDSQTISITDTHDDKFITEAGVGIDAWLCHILDPTMDIRSYLVFRDVEVNNWEPLENATLRLRTTVTQDFDADSSVTIYGMKYSDLQDEGVINPSFVLSVPYTSASVPVNTSQFYGQQWHEVNVTSIVEELIRSYDWDGDGNIGETGDSIGFVIVGAEGHDTRWFIDYHYGTPSLASQLVIHWNHEPPPPAGYEDTEFNETRGNFTIWYREGGAGYPLEPMEYVFALVYDVMYDTVHDLPDTSVKIEDCIQPPLESNNQRKIIRQSNGVIQVVYWEWDGTANQIYIEKSENNGVTWIGKTNLCTYSGMDTENQDDPAIAVDSYDNLNVLWYGEATGFTGRQIWHNKFVNATQTWSGPERISTYVNMSISHQGSPSIAVDSEDNLHASWYGKASGIYGQEQIWYSTQNKTHWNTPIRISNYTDMDLYPQYGSCIAVAPDDNLHVTWRGMASGFTTDKQIWYSNYTSSWLNPLRISTKTGMNNYDQASSCIALDSMNQVHIVWKGMLGAYPTIHQIWYSNYNHTIWSEPLRLSTYSNMGGNNQLEPTIAIDSDDYIYVVWPGGATGHPLYDTWLTKKETEWSAPVTIQETDSTAYANLRWATWPAELAEDEWYVHETDVCTVTGPFDSHDNATDWIDTEKPDPEDPDPGGQWSEGPGGETGPFTRFRFRLYLLFLGFGCIFGTIMFFAWKKPSGYQIFCGAIIIILGVGLLLSIGQV